MWLCGVRSASDLGIAGCCPTCRLGIACGNTNVGSRSGLFSRLRFRVPQLLSTVSSSSVVHPDPQVRLNYSCRGQESQNGGVSLVEAAFVFVFSGRTTR